MYHYSYSAWSLWVSSCCLSLEDSSHWIYSLGPGFRASGRTFPAVQRDRRDPSRCSRPLSSVPMDPLGSTHGIAYPYISSARAQSATTPQKSPAPCTDWSEKSHWAPVPACICEPFQDGYPSVDQACGTIYHPRLHSIGHESSFDPDPSLLQLVIPEKQTAMTVLSVCSYKKHTHLFGTRPDNEYQTNPAESQ